MPKKIIAAALAAALAAGCGVPFQAPRGPVGASMALAALSPEAPGAETLGGRLKYNLAAVSDRGDILVKTRAGSVAPAGSVATELPGVYRVASSDRQADIRRIAGGPGVEFVEPDAPVEQMGGDPRLSLQWGLEKTRAAAAWAAARGEGVLVAVVDSGVNHGHEELAGRVLAGPDFVNGDEDPMDDNGHGTHVAGIVAAAAGNGAGAAGVAPGARILAVKVLNSRGRGTTSGAAAGVRHAVRAGARVVNLSLGAPFDSGVLREAVRDALASGVLVVAAAGNSGSQASFYPAAQPGVIAVGSSDRADARSVFSNHGPWVTVAAPGQGIYSSWKTGGYAVLSGTSMAAPQVAGAAALVMSARPGLSAAQVREAIEKSGDPVAGFEANPAVRRLNVVAALGFGPAPVAVPSPLPSVAPTPAPTPTPRATPTPAPLTARLAAFGSGKTDLTVVWSTSRGALGTLEIGEAPGSLVPYGPAPARERLVHRYKIENLKPKTRYYLRARFAGNGAETVTETYLSTR